MEDVSGLTLLYFIVNTHVLIYKKKLTLVALHSLNGTRFKGLSLCAYNVSISHFPVYIFRLLSR